MIRIHLGASGLIAILLVAAGNAHADLVYHFNGNSLGCGGGDFTGTEVVYTATDKAGDIFTLNCVDRDYFQGSVFVKSTGMTTSFGRCIYVNGANVLNFEVDKDNNFTDIEWVNVKPPKLTDASRDAVVAALDNNVVKEPTPDWLLKVIEYLDDNNLEGGENNQIYRFPFSPNNQEIGVFQNSTLVIKEVLTPDEANASYLDNGFSPLSDLTIDPIMRIPDASFQATNPVPEPSSFLLCLVGLAGGWFLRYAKNPRADAPA